MPNPNQAPPPIDGPANVPSLRTLGTGSQQAVSGSDSRLSTPTNAQTTPAADKIPLSTSDGFIDSRWLRFGVNVKDFGAVGDGVADDSAAIQAALDYTTSLSGFAQGRTVYVPEGRYSLETTLYVRRQVTLIGETAGSFFSAAVLLPAKNITAIQIDFENLIDAPERRGGGSIVENFKIVYQAALPTVWQSSTSYSVGDLVVSQPGADDFAGQALDPKISNIYTMECTSPGTSGSSTPNWDATTPLTNAQGPLTYAEGATISDGSVTWTVRLLAGVRMHVNAQLKSVWVEGSPGNGFLLTGDVASNPYSNINNFSLENCTANSGGMHGLFVQGACGNAGNVKNFLAISNRRWGIYDRSFLGNTYIGCNGSTNVDLRAVTSIARVGNTVTVTMADEHGLLPGNTVGQWGEPDPNFPTGRWPVETTPTAKSFTYTQAGSAVSGSGSFLFMIAGGAFKSYDYNARNVFIGCYSESDQFGSEFALPSTVIGGLHAAGFAEGGSLAPMWIDGVFGSANGTVFQDFRNDLNPKRTFSQMGLSEYALHISSDSEGEVFEISSLTRVSNIVTAETSTPHGFLANERHYVTAINDSNFAGGLKTILAVPTATSFTYIEAGSDASGIDGHYALGGGGTGFTFADNGSTNYEGWWIWRHANLDGRKLMCWSGSLAAAGPGHVWFPQGLRLGGHQAHQNLFEFGLAEPTTWATPVVNRGSIRLNADNYPQAGFTSGIFGWQFINDSVGTGVQVLRWPHFGWVNQIDVTNGVGSPYAVDWKQHAGVTFTNEGATAKVYFALEQSFGFPDLRCEELSFFVKDSDGIRIVAPASRKIRWGTNVTAAAGYLESTTVGSWLKLKLIGTILDPEYLVTEFTGTWTDGVFSVTTTNNLTGPITSVGNATSITDAAVTLAKMADLAQDQFIGRTTASTGVPETATITAAARTVLDDTTVAAMVDTLGGGASTGSGVLVRATSPIFTTPNIGTATGSITGNAATVTTNANLTGPITSVGNATTIADAELAAIAGLTSAADRLPYFTGSGTAALATFTTVARTVLDDATADDMLTTLGGATYTGTGGLVRLAAPALTGLATGDRLTLTSTSGTALTATGEGALPGGVFTGGITGVGLTAIGGATSGRGATFTGSAGVGFTNNYGLLATGGGGSSSHGVVGQAGSAADAHGVWGTGVNSTTSAGVRGSGSGVGVGGSFTSGATDASRGIIVDANNLSSTIGILVTGVTTGFAISAETVTSGRAVNAAATSGTGVLGAATTGTGVSGTSNNTGIGVLATNAATGYALSIVTNPTSPAKAAVNWMPQDTQPTGAHSIGDMYVFTGGILFVCTVAGTPGTWVRVGDQTSDIELLALAGLTSAADRLPYFTGSGTASLATFTSAARTVLDDASVSDMVDTLGGGAATGSGVLVRKTGAALVSPTITNGVVSTGASSDGIGVDGFGGTTNGIGVRGQGAGTGTGIRGIGGSSSGIGVEGTASGTGTGVKGTGGTSAGYGVEGVGGTTSGTGVHGLGGATNGIGVVGIGSGSGSGVEGVAATTGSGVVGTGGATSGSGVVGTGTGTGASGVVGTGGATSGSGVVGTGTGTGTGISGTGGVTNGAAGIIGTAGGTTGVLGSSTIVSAGTIGILGIGRSTGVGVEGHGGESNGRGVLGVAGGSGGAGVEGQGDTGVLGTGVSYGVWGTGGPFGILGQATDDGGCGVKGAGNGTNVNGVLGDATGTGCGVVAQNTATGYALKISPDTSSPVKAAVCWTPQNAQPTGTHLVGDMYVGSTGVLFVCTVAGTPGTWVRVADQLTTNANLTGPVTSVGNATTITADAVTNAMLADMVAHTFKGNNTGSTANPVDMTVTQATAELNAVVGDTGSGGTKGLVPAPSAGDAASGKFLSADGTFDDPLAALNIYLQTAFGGF